MGGYSSGGGRGAMRQGQFWDLDTAVLKRLDMLRPGFQKSLVWSTNGKNAPASKSNATVITSS